MQPRPDPRWSSSASERSTRTLFHQLAAASFALDRAFESDAGRDEHVGEARQALEAFDLLERTTAELIVPGRVRGRIRRAVEELASDRLELARADLKRAEGELHHWLTDGRRA